MAAQSPVTIALLLVALLGLGCVELVHAQDNTTTTTTTTTTTVGPTTTEAPAPTTTTQAPASPTPAPTPSPTPAPGGLAGDTDYSESQKFGISCATFACLAFAWGMFCFVYGKIADRCSPEPQGPKYAVVPQANKI